MNLESPGTPNTQRRFSFSNNSANHATYAKADKTISGWIKCQLANRESLKPDQKEKLIALGIAPVMPLQWEKGFQRALCYIEQGLSFGSVTSREVVRTWIKRQVKRRNQLTLEQQQKLLGITSRLTDNYFPLKSGANRNVFHVKAYGKK